MNFMKDFKHDTHSKNATRSHIINNVEKLDWNDIFKNDLVRPHEYNLRQSKNTFFKCLQLCSSLPF